ncbi:hypothetical protein [Pyxidicoccus xibeiensis]|uniref:hypothetical protein n=1 Tax=Pyxidicoccus xibeiensis TaxID=2906759 RepID=UPI0020A6F99B|nr:hypothetical protein [Pyxidicoccus xibeiensis]MCP3144648.1 hypothetical protein [Pyxidicoccus xibeiensis]
MDSSPAAPTCLRCHAPRAPAPECPRCGIIYAKAEARAARQAMQALAPAPAPAEAAVVEPETQPLIDPAWLAPPPELRSDVLPERTPDVNGDAEEALFELKLRTWVLPASLLVAYLSVSSAFGFVVRLFTMPLHELGHALTAWFCGFSAVPTLWKTLVFERSYGLAALAAAGLGALAWQGWKRKRLGWVAAGGGLLFLQLIGTLLLSHRTGQMLISFGGDAGMMVLGTGLMTTFYSRPGSYMHEHGLRWGFVVIGAMSFMDGFNTWWKAKRDMADIPFGQNEGVGLSDASTLVDRYGWDERDLIRRYLVLGTLCLIFLAVLYTAQLLRGRARLLEKA